MFVKHKSINKLKKYYEEIDNRTKHFINHSFTVPDSARPE